MKTKKVEVILQYPISSCSMYNWDRILEKPEIPDILKEMNFFFKRKHCKGCSVKDQCVHNPLKIKTTQLLFDATEKFLNKRFSIVYPKRSFRSESINGSIKGSYGTYKLVRTTDLVIINEIHLKNNVYNLFRHEKIKGISRNPYYI